MYINKDRKKIDKNEIHDHIRFLNVQMIKKFLNIVFK